jgi:hypothetical protein
MAAGVRLATDPELRGRLRVAGRAAVEEQSWEKVIARFEAISRRRGRGAHAVRAAPVLA